MKNLEKLIKEVETKLAKVAELNREIIQASQIDYSYILDVLIENHKPNGGK